MKRWKKVDRSRRKKGETDCQRWARPAQKGAPPTMGVFEQKFITPVPVNLESSNLLGLQETGWGHLWWVADPGSVHKGIMGGICA